MYLIGYYCQHCGWLVYARSGRPSPICSCGFVVLLGEDMDLAAFSKRSRPCSDDTEDRETVMGNYED